MIPASGHYYLYGLHAVQAALQNRQRVKRRLIGTTNGMQRLTRIPDGFPTQSVTTQQLRQALGEQPVHQGVMLEVQPLPQPSLEEVATGKKTLILLDQVSDPQNIGAILRSAAAFDAGAVICQEKHAPKENATLAKIAAGGLECVPYLNVTNLSRALETLQMHGYWSIGLEGRATQELHHCQGLPHIVLVLGAEGKGLRPLIAKHCDHLVTLPIHPQMESLNVSVAAGISLYHLTAMKEHQGK